MLNSKAIAQIVLPYKEFFIHNADEEYCYRLRNYGEIILILDEKIFHEEENTKEIVKIVLFGKVILRR